ncbi:Hypothetical protein CINCED_3A012669 [Cinara cedri]|uniref:Uncharacterized protein n=1 Tax=Cinara cedri TaxID=506608 RepID=A0A5E4M7P3_9HEMI|nr:Hypothetical protein CINCED_3A012669 [Cinara cedri]
MRVADEGVMNLGFKFIHKLDPGSHINYVCCKGFKTLRFIMKLSKNIRSRMFIKALFYELVRPILEYDADVWDPHTANDSLQLERVQQRFMRFACNLLQIPCEPYDYTPLSDLLN